jgi:hypothetical protein
MQAPAAGQWICKNPCLAGSKRIRQPQQRADRRRRAQHYARSVLQIGDGYESARTPQPAPKIGVRPTREAALVESAPRLRRPHNEFVPPSGFAGIEVGPESLK